MKNAQKKEELPKVLDEKVLEMRNIMHRLGWKPNQLASFFGVSQSLISQIFSGKKLSADSVELNNYLEKLKEEQFRRFPSESPPAEVTFKVKGIEIMLSEQNGFRILTEIVKDLNAENKRLLAEIERLKKMIVPEQG